MVKFSFTGAMGNTSKLTANETVYGFNQFNQERGSNEDVEVCGVSVTVPSVSAKWMKNRKKCDTTEMCFFCTTTGKSGCI